MDQSKEYEIRQSLIADLKGLRHNLYHNSPEYKIAQDVLHEVRNTECAYGRLLREHAVFLAERGIFVGELLD